MKLIVGLGNPGRKYAKTRHNVGFDVLAELARRHATGKPRGRFQGDLVDAVIEGERAALLCPTNYMNNSGGSVQLARDFYKLDHEDLMVVCDDFHLPVAKLRIRTKGSAGGQKGLQDIIRRLGTEQFPRLRIGIGPPKENWDVSDFVLSQFSEEERAEIDRAVARAAAAVAVWIRDGIESCMNQFNPASNANEVTGD